MRNARQVGSAVLTFMVIGWLIWRGAAAMEYNWQWYRVHPFFYRIVDGEFIWGPLYWGLLETLKLAIVSGILAILIGFITAFARMSNSRGGGLIATWYLEAIRNTPLLVQLFLFYFVLAPIFGIDRFWSGVLCLAFFEGSFAAEIIRGGIQGVDRGQFEASDSVGLTVKQIPLHHRTAGHAAYPATTNRTVDFIDQTLGHRQRHRRIRADHHRLEPDLRHLHGV